MAHLLKRPQAALEESRATGSDLPVLAATRLLAAPRAERFVTGAVTETLAFVRTGRPPIR